MRKHGQRGSKGLSKVSMWLKPNPTVAVERDDAPNQLCGPFPHQAPPRPILDQGRSDDTDPPGRRRTCGARLAPPRKAGAGWSLYPGEELTSVGSRYPQRVAGLVYLDAAYPYVFENAKGPTMAEFREGPRALPPEPSPSSADRASYTAGEDFWGRTRGFRLPEAMFTNCVACCCERP
jgi:hypothetical protein